MLAYKSLRGSSSSDHLDLVRGAAALEVLLGHLRGLFFVDSPANSNFLIRVVYFATDFGRESVMIFFVLSGFLIGGTVLRGKIDGDFSWSVYSTNRLTRLWVVLIPALFLCAFWDHLGIRIFGTSGIYGLVPGSTGRYAVLPRLSGVVLLDNALFLQGIIAPTYGSNGPLWSLSYEFWYYVIFPLIVLAFPAKKIDRSTVLYAGATCAVAFFIRGPILAYFPVWLLGAAINFAPQTSGRRAQLWIGIATLALLSVLAAIRFIDLTRYLQDLAVGVASASLVFAFLCSRTPSRSRLYSRTVGKLAGFSYSLYLVHLPALIFFSAWLVPRGRWQPDAFHIAIVASLGICALAYSIFVARLTEYRTAAVRSRVIAYFGVHRVSDAA
jgi:peptidoglycan/LPS O-acetylase OafA/YrhL